MEMFLAILTAIVIGDLFSRVLNFYEARRTERLFEEKMNRMKEMHSEMQDEVDKEAQKILENLIKGGNLPGDKDRGEWKYLD